MTVYTLTTEQDLINAGGTNDTFAGPGGGNDALRGYAGKDNFKIEEFQTGLIDGGTEHDRLYMIGQFNNEFDAGLNIARVEELVMESTNLYATVKQLAGFTKYTID